MVAVPVERVLQVYRFLASLEEGRGDEGLEAQPLEWTASSVARVMELLSRRAQELVLALADRQGEWTSADTVREALKLEEGERGFSQLQGLIGSVRKNSNWVDRGLPLLIEKTEGPHPDLRIDPDLARLVMTTDWRRREQA